MEDRFTRIKWLFESEFEKLQNAKILICGCGGIGGVCIDALYRTAVVNLTVIDYDKFTITDQNRQIGSQFIGEQKVSIFEKLYPGIKGINQRLDEENINQSDFYDFDLIIDCIDDVPSKVALAKKYHKKLISSMGGARRMDITQIKISSIWNTVNDPFAKKIRYQLKKSQFDGDYEVVFSTEMPKCVMLGSFIGVTGGFGLSLANLAIKKIIV